MKNLLLISILFFYSFVTSAQNNDEIYVQIESARTMQEMPIIQVTAFRDSKNIGIREDRYNTKREVSKGEILTFYFPIQIYSKSGQWTQTDESYNFICLKPAMSQDASIMHINIISHLNKSDRDLFRKWLFKYEALGKELVKKQ